MLRLVLIALIALPAVVQAAQFYSLGAVEDGLGLDYVVTMSADGATVLTSNFANRRSALWTRQQGLRQLATPFLAADLSADGSTVVGSVRVESRPRHLPAKWTERGGLEIVYLEAGFHSAGLSRVSADGSIALGANSALEFFLYDGGLTPVPLSAAYDLSADGEVVVGQFDGQPYSWNGEVQALSERSGYATHVSANGDEAYGMFDPPYEAFRWNAAGGAAPVFDCAQVTAMSSNGQFATGFCAVPSLITAQGVVPLTSLLPPGWSNLEPSAVADDGLTVAGRALNPAGDWQAWVADLGSTWIPGDANRDGAVDLLDFGLLRTNFGASRSWAYGDFSGDGRIDLDDFGTLKQGFGQSGASVPEPAAALSAAIAVFVLIGSRRLTKRTAGRAALAPRT
jgi:hypothetical protein